MKNEVDYELLAEEYSINSSVMIYSNCSAMDEEEREEMFNRQKEIEKVVGFSEFYQHWLSRKNNILAHKKY